MIVVDASVAAKLVIAEHDSGMVESWYSGTKAEIVAPDIVIVEVAQAVVRRVNMREWQAARGRVTIRAWRQILDGQGITLVTLTPSQVEAAADLAMTLGHPVKDCLYLALAMELQATLVTADVRFVAKARAIYADVAAVKELH